MRLLPCPCIRRSLTGLLAVGALAALAGPNDVYKSDHLEVVFQFTLAPSGITALPEGGWVFSVDQAEKPKTRVVKVTGEGKVEPFPNDRMSDAADGEPLPLDAVEGMTLDADRVIWMLDNGRRGEVTPKVIGWNQEKRRLLSVHYLGQPAVVPGSFLADLAVDPSFPFIYITDPANGQNAALIVLDRSTGLARRVLQGHRSVIPDEAVPLSAGRQAGSARRLDGSQTFPHSGVDPLVLDRKGEWLYFAPIRSTQVYRIKTESLRAMDLDPARLAEKVEVWAEKPPATAMTLDVKGNLYLGDFEGHAVGVIENDKKRAYRVIASDPRLLWPDGLCFGADEKLYFFSRSSWARASLPSVPATAVEHNLFRVQPLAAGRPGD